MYVVLFPAVAWDAKQPFWAKSWMLACGTYINVDRNITIRQIPNTPLLSCAKNLKKTIQIQKGCDHQLWLQCSEFASKLFKFAFHLGMLESKPVSMTTGYRFSIVLLTSQRYYSFFGSRAHLTAWNTCDDPIWRLRHSQIMIKW